MYPRNLILRSPWYLMVVFFVSTTWALHCLSLYTSSVVYVPSLLVNEGMSRSNYVTSKYFMNRSPWSWFNVKHAQPHTYAAAGTRKCSLWPAFRAYNWHIYYYKLIPGRPLCIIYSVPLPVLTINK